MNTTQLRQSIDTMVGSARFEKFERYLKANETIARSRLHDALKETKPVVLSDWFFDFIKNRIVPLFAEFGMEEALTWSMFKMAAPSWESMQPAAVEGIWFNPFYIRVIEETKSRLNQKPEYERRAHEEKTARNIKALSSAGKTEQLADELLDLIHNLSFSWVILPRSYRLLEKDNARTLTGYLRYLGRETNSDFRQLMIRIMIEYVGNFAMKYMNPCRNRQRMLNILFYGYAAAFWKTLRKPPAGLENMTICRNYLLWARSFQLNVGQMDYAKSLMLTRMDSALIHVFSRSNAFGLSRSSVDRIDGIWVALRHGKPGLLEALRYLGRGNPLSLSRSPGGIPYATVPGAVSTLLTGLKQGYQEESLATQQTIRQFLKKLKENYRSGHGKSAIKTTETDITFQFVSLRVERMVNEFFK